MFETTETRRRVAEQLGVHLLSALLMMWVCFLNGFPLMGVDSGSYMRTGFEFRYSIDRPLTYGLLIMPFERSLGLWAIPFAQGLLSTWLIGRLLKALFGTSSPLRLLCVMLFLAAASSLPWVAGQLLPDIFAPLVGIVIFLLVFGRSILPRWERRLLPFVLAAMIATHMSHLALGASMIVVTLALGLLFGPSKRQVLTGSASAVGALFLALIGLSSVNAAAGNGFRPSVMTNSFLLVKLLNERLAQQPLDQMCAGEDLLLCRIVPGLNDPRSALPGQDYLWDTRYKLTMVGGKALEVANNNRLLEEEARLVRRTLATRPLAVISQAMAEWGKQIVVTEVGDGLWVYGPEMAVNQQIHAHFPSQVSAWSRSLQQTGRIPAFAYSPDIWISALIALLIPVIVWWARRRGDRAIAAFAAQALSLVLINAAVCGMLSWIIARYQSRVLWLLPLVGIIVLIRLWEVRRARGESAA